MRKVTKEFTVFNYDELSEEAQNRVLCDELDFYIQIRTGEVYDNDGRVRPEHRNSNLYKAIRECEAMHTPWFIGEYIMKYCRNEIMENVRSQEYLETGRIFN